MDEDLDFGEIVTFLRVVESGSYSRAAEALHTSKSSVSRRISRLEARLGVRLFARTTRSLRLTEEGSAFHARVSGAIEEVEEAARAVRDLGGRPRGLLRVTGPSDLPFLGAMFAEFRREFPDVTVDVMLTQRTVDLVRDGYDVAVRAGPLRESGLVTRELSVGRMLICAGRGYAAERGLPGAPAEIEGHDCVTFNAPTLRQPWNLLGPAGPVRIDVEGHINTNVFTLARELALADAGLTMVPEVSVREDLASGALVRVLPDHVFDMPPIHLVYPGGRHLSRKVGVFCAFAQDWMARRMGG